MQVRTVIGNSASLFLAVAENQSRCISCLKIVNKVVFFDFFQILVTSVENYYDTQAKELISSPIKILIEKNIWNIQLLLGNKCWDSRLVNKCKSKNKQTLM